MASAVFMMHDIQDLITSELLHVNRLSATVLTQLAELQSNWVVS